MPQIPAVTEHYHSKSTQPHLHYLQGPQGDPFAPQPSPTYLPVEVELPVPPKPIKKKRKPRRETDCSFCGGDDTKNKEGEPETMVTCADCGRSGESIRVQSRRLVTFASGHPTCLKLAEQADTLRSYEWQCTECKTCEECQEKDGEVCVPPIQHFDSIF